MAFCSADVANPSSDTSDRYRAVFDAAFDGIVMAAADGGGLDVNAAGREAIGYSQEELARMTLLDLLVPGSTLDFTLPRVGRWLQCKDGTRVHVELERVADGSLFCMIFRHPLPGVAEETPATRERLFRALVEHSHDGVVFLDAESRITYGSPAATRISGFPPGELNGRTVFELLHPDDLPQAAAQLSELQHRPRQVLSGRWRVRTVAGDFRWVDTTATNLLAEPVVRALVVHIRDATELVNNEEGLRRFERVLSATPDLVSLVDDRYVYRLVNRAYLQAHGLEAERIVGRSVPDLLGGEVFETVVRPHLDQALRGQPVSYEQWFEFAAAGRRFISVTYSPYRDVDGQYAGVIVSARDQTALRAAAEALEEKEEELRQAQKMEFVGRLAGGIAHDFNNLLTVIASYSALIEGSSDASADVREMAREIGTAGDRATAMTRQLLAFSRKQLLAPRVLSLNATVEGMQVMLRRLMPENIELEVVLAPDLAKTKADAHQLEQVLLNLAVNARDAMPQGGRITIRTRNTQTDEGERVMLSVSDTGHGIDADTRDKIFAPFFTTKAPGQGTGLGLSMVYGFVTQSGGSISVESEPGRGSTFTVLLPVSEGDAAPQAPRRSTTPVARPSRATILLAEDEAGVRGLLERVLRGAGYTVLAAENGRAALERARDHAGDIDLLLTDVVMPVMGGPELVAALLPVRPDLRVLYMSGYAENVIAHQGVLPPGVVLIEKPLRPNDVLRRVAAMLVAP
ncbi:MAG: PAS domain S-box protein [Myxococcales bacterium]|nr:PAS domain S-box protein [Myxococcales bacterium]